MGVEELSARMVKGKRRYRCSWCMEWIEIGEVHQYRAYKMDGDFKTDREHAECAKAMDTAGSAWWHDHGSTYEPGEFKRGTTEPVHP